jgi:UDP-glucose 4-epimerase
MRKRILITGGGGFVGRVLVRLLSIDHEVCVVDTMQMGRDRFKEAEYTLFKLVQVDICHADDVQRVITEFRPEVIVHLAAIHYIPLCEKEPGSAIQTNVVGTSNLLAACPPDCRFVFASSGAVYSPSDDPHHEERSEIGPRDIYGFSKLHGEQFVRYFTESKGLPSVVVRLFNVVGPGETNPHLLPEIVAQMKAGRSAVRLGNLWPKRDYIHVRDAAAGFAAVALKGVVGSGETVTVNLGTSQQYSVEEIINRLRSLSGKPFVVESDPDRVRAVDRPYLGAAIGEIARRFGWAPLQNIDSAVRDIWAEPDFSIGLRQKYGLPLNEPSARRD